MNAFFLSVLNMSLTGAFVIAAICIVRQLLKKAPKALSYALWIVVGFRLAFPFTIESAFSLLPFNATPIPASIATAPQSVLPTNSVITPLYIPLPYVVDNALPTMAYSDFSLPWISIVAWLWFAGVVLMVTYGIVSFIVLKRKMRNALWVESNIYEADNIKSPFVLGIFSPKIYLPMGLAAHERGYIILHEQTHIKRRDHIVKLAAYFILCVHWFNPLAWVAFWLMGADMEMSCDERVINELGNDIGKEYSLSLVRMATGGRITSRSINITPLAFGEGGIKERVKRVLNFKKPSRTIIIATFVLVIVLSAGFAFDRTANAQKESNLGVDTSEENDFQVAEQPNEYGNHSTEPPNENNNHSTEPSNENNNRAERQPIREVRYDAIPFTSMIAGNARGGIFSGSNNMFAGDQGALVTFYSVEGLWFVPPGMDINFANAEPFLFDDWLHNTFGVTADNANIDALLESTFLERRTGEFSILLHLDSSQREYLLKKAVDAREIAFVSLLFA